MVADSVVAALQAEHPHDLAAGPPNNKVALGCVRAGSVQKRRNLTGSISTAASTVARSCGAAAMHC